MTPHTNPTVWSLTASVAIVGSNSLALGPIAPDIAAHLQASLASVLHASAAFGAGTATSAFFFARYIDRFGIKASLTAALLLLTIAFAACSLATTAWHLVVAQFVAGIAAGVALPACYSGAAIIAPPEQSSRVLGIVLAGWTISLVLGVSLSTVVADNIHWRSVYALFAVTSAAITFYNLRAELPGKPPPQKTISMLHAFRIKGVPSLLAQVACYMTAFYGVYNLIGDHVVSTLLQPLSANAWIALSYGTGFGLAVLLDPVIDKVTEAGKNGDHNSAQRKFPMTAIALFTLSLLYVALAYFAGNFVTLLVTAGIWGLLNHLGLNILIASLNQTNTKYRGAVLGLYSGITYVCMSIGTLVFSGIYQWGNIQWLCLVAAALCLLATAIAIASQR